MTSHTHAILYISEEAYSEIERLLREAGYNHLFQFNGGTIDTVDMTGIALKKIKKQPLDIQ